MSNLAAIHVVLPPAQLMTYYKNPRRGDVDAIRASLNFHGQYRPLVVNKGTGTGRPYEVLAGNHTLMGIRDLAISHPDDARWSSVDCWLIDVDNDNAARIVAADNRTAELGGFDDVALLALLQGIPDLSGTGYSADDLADLAALVEEITIPKDVTDPEPRISDDGLIRQKDIETLEEEYADRAQRLIVMPVPIPQFIWVQDKLAAFRTERSLDTNSAALLCLLADWSGETPPEVTMEEVTEAYEDDEAEDDEAEDDEADVG